MYDVIVIGGGPSGLMAAIAAAEKNRKVLLLEKGSKLGKKLAISGGGRCNVTNRLSAEEIIKHIPGNGRFLYSPFTVYNNEDIIAFFVHIPNTAFIFGSSCVEYLICSNVFLNVNSSFCLTSVNSFFIVADSTY